MVFGGKMDFFFFPSDSKSSLWKLATLCEMLSRNSWRVSNTKMAWLMLIMLPPDVCKTSIWQAVNLMFGLFHAFNKYFRLNLKICRQHFKTHTLSFDFWYFRIRDPATNILSWGAGWLAGLTMFCRRHLFTGFFLKSWKSVNFCRRRVFTNSTVHEMCSFY